MIVMINFLNNPTYRALDSRKENSNVSEKKVNFRAETYERTANFPISEDNCLTAYRMTVLQ